MNLSELLSFADIGLLSKIARHYQCECNGHSKNELIQAILTTLNRKDTFERQMQQLTEQDIRLMNRLLFDRRPFFSFEELSALIRQTVRTGSATAGAGGETGSDDEINPRDTILRLRNLGWLFNGHSQQTKYLYRMPEDIKRRFAECYSAHLRRQLTYIDSPQAYRDESHIIAQDVLLFLRFVHQNEIVLTIDGAMYKRTLQQLLSTLHVREETVKSRGWRFGYGRKFKDYPDRFSFIYDYCYYSGLIEENQHTLRLTKKGEQRVLGNAREDVYDMYKLWLKLYKGPIPNLQTLVHWIHMLCDRWTTLESLYRTLQPMIQPFYYDHPEQILKIRIVQMMLHLGLLQVGEDQLHGPVVRVSKLGNSIISGAYVPEDEWIRLEDAVPLTWGDRR